MFVGMTHPYDKYGFSNSKNALIVDAIKWNGCGDKLQYICSYKPVCVDTKALVKILNPLSMCLWIESVEKVLKILFPDPMNSDKWHEKCKKPPI